MPYSYNFFIAETLDFIKASAPSGKILDVGPGSGKFGIYLRKDFPNGIDAIEIFEPYIEKFYLTKIYRKVIVGDIREAIFEQNEYDLVIMGDILEHLSIEDAQRVTQYLSAKGASIVALVPYLYLQDFHPENHAEIHLQPDLTREIFLQRYPEFVCLLDNDKQGVFYMRGKQLDE